jgi:hypothetical protein
MTKKDKGEEVIETKIDKPVKKAQTPERLEQLARARKKALEIRQAGAALKEEQKQMADAALAEKLERERLLNEAVKKSLIPNVVSHDLLPVPRYTNTVVPDLATYEEEEEEEEPPQPVIIKKKTKKLPKARIVVEQSSDESDYESNDHIIFVKRKHKVVKATTPAPPNTPEEQYVPPTPIPRKPQPEFTNFVDMMANNGGFVNRRKYY